jgi:hypothetical protein
MFDDWDTIRSIKDVSVESWQRYGWIDWPSVHSYGSLTAHSAALERYLPHKILWKCENAMSAKEYKLALSPSSSAFPFILQKVLSRSRCCIYFQTPKSRSGVWLQPTPAQPSASIDPSKPNEFALVEVVGDNG